MTPRVTLYYNDDGPARQQREVLGPVAAKWKGRVEFVEERVAGGEGGIDAVPTIVVTDEEGNEVRRFVGFQRRPVIERALLDVA